MKSLLLFGLLFVVFGYFLFDQRNTISSLEREREDHLMEIQNLKDKITQLETRVKTEFTQRKTALTPPSTPPPAQPAPTPRHGDWMWDPNASASSLNKKKH